MYERRRRRDVTAPVGGVPPDLHDGTGMGLAVLEKVHTGSGGRRRTLPPCDVEMETPALLVAAVWGNAPQSLDIIAVDSAVVQVVHVPTDEDES